MNGRRRGAEFVALALALALSVGCGASLGSLGASDQAKKDLDTDPAGAGGRVREPAGVRNDGDLAADDDRSLRYVCWAVDQQVLAVTPCLTNPAREVGGQWQWVSASGQVSAEPTPGSAGGWLWVWPSGRVSATSLRPADGQWRWISPTGTVFSSSQDDGGAWYWITSTAQVSATPVPGSTRVARAGSHTSEGWYWTPDSTTDTSAPVTGGSGPKPTSPTTWADVLTGSLPDASGFGRNRLGACEPDDGTSDAQTALVVDSRCPVPLDWTTISITPAAADGQYTVTGDVGWRVVGGSDLHARLAADLHVNPGGPLTIAGIRTDSPELRALGNFERVDSGEVQAATECTGLQIQLHYQVKRDEATSSQSSLRICDAELTPKLLALR